FLGEPGLAGDLLRARRTRQPLRQRSDRGTDRENPLLELTRHPHSPRRVAEVAPKLAEDSRRRESRERHAALGIEALDRLQQADRRDLQQVVVGDAAVPVTAGEMVRDAEVALDQLVAECAVTRAAVLVEVRVDRPDGLGAGGRLAHANRYAISRASFCISTQ